MLENKNISYLKQNIPGDCPQKDGVFAVYKFDFESNKCYRDGELYGDILEFTEMESKIIEVIIKVVSKNKYLDGQEITIKL